MNFFILNLIFMSIITLMCPILARAGEVGTFEKADCPFDLPESIIEGENFIFGYVTVPEQHAHPEGSTIRLAVGVFPDIGDNPNPDPLVLTAGGPGECIMDSFISSFAGEAGDAILSNRAAIGIAVRGTCYSEPSLLFKEKFDMQLAILNQNLNTDEALAELLEVTRVFRDRLVGEGVNLSAYNNVESAADVAMVMSALGYDKFNLYGNSAGTILAQHVMRDYPELLRSVILSSPVPVGVSAAQDMIANGVKMLQQIFERFSADAEFNAKYPNLESDFLNLLEELNANPVTLSVKNPANGETIGMLLNGDRLAHWLFIRMFANPYFPAELAKMVSGDYSHVQNNPGVFFPMYTFSQGLAYGVICSELIGPKAEVTIDESYTIFVDAVTVAGFGSEFGKRSCEIWNVPMLDEYARKPIKSDVPTLILCGEFDHVCPPRYGEFLGQNLSRAYVYIFPGVAHSPIDAGVGPIMMTLEFLADPTRKPHSSYIDDYKLEITPK